MRVGGRGECLLAVSGRGPCCVILRSNWTNQYLNWKERLGLHWGSPPGPPAKRDQLLVAPQRQRTCQELIMICITLFPHLYFSWEIKKKNVILFLLACS